MRRTIPILFMSLVFATGAFADHGGNRSNGYRNDFRGNGNGGFRGNYTVPQRDLGMLRNYYRGNGYGPGSRRGFQPAYRGGYPAGWVRGGALPRNWQRYFQPIPLSLARSLGPLPFGYQRGIVNGYLAVVDVRSGFIVELVPLF